MANWLLARRDRLRRLVTRMLGLPHQGAVFGLLLPHELTFCPLRLSNLLPSALSSPFGPTNR
jgi:hypothetical protein